MRLIDEKELKEWVENWFEVNRYYHPYSKSNNIPITELYDILEHMPTIDAEPVVRCCDCKYLQCNMRQDGILPFGVDEYECRHWCGSCDPMDFCSYGERREE